MVLDKKIFAISLLMVLICICSVTLVSATSISNDCDAVVHDCEMENSLYNNFAIFKDVGVIPSNMEFFSVKSVYDVKVDSKLDNIEAIHYNLVDYKFTKTNSVLSSEKAKSNLLPSEFKEGGIILTSNSNQNESDNLAIPGSDNTYYDSNVIYLKQLALERNKIGDYYCGGSWNSYYGPFSDIGSLFKFDAKYSTGFIGSPQMNVISNVEKTYSNNQDSIISDGIRPEYIYDSISPKEVDSAIEIRISSNTGKEVDTIKKGESLVIGSSITGFMGSPQMNFLSSINASLIDTFDGNNGLVYGITGFQHPVAVKNTNVVVSKDNNDSDYAVDGLGLKDAEISKIASELKLRKVSKVLENENMGGVILNVQKSVESLENSTSDVSMLLERKPKAIVESENTELMQVEENQESYILYCYTVNGLGLKEAKDLKSSEIIAVKVAIENVSDMKDGASEGSTLWIGDKIDTFSSYIPSFALTNYKGKSVANNKLYFTQYVPTESSNSEVVSITPYSSSSWNYERVISENYLRSNIAKTQQNSLQNSIQVISTESSEGVSAVPMMQSTVKYGLENIDTTANSQYTGYVYKYSADIARINALKDTINVQAVNTANNEVTMMWHEDIVGSWNADFFKELVV